MMPTHIMFYGVNFHSGKHKSNTDRHLLVFPMLSVKLITEWMVYCIISRPHFPEFIFLASFQHVSSYYTLIISKSNQWYQSKTSWSYSYTWHRHLLIFPLKLMSDWKTYLVLRFIAILEINTLHYLEILPDWMIKSWPFWFKRFIAVVLTSSSLTSHFWDCNQNTAN